jgi:death-on-curing family protein
MKKSRRTLKSIASGAGIDPDNLLIALWYFNNAKFNYLKNENSEVKLKDLKSVFKTIELKFSNKNNEVRATVHKVEPIVYRNFDFRTVGKPIDNILYLKEEDVLTIYDELVKDFNSDNDPIEPSGVKDYNLLLSAITHPQTSLDGIFKYPTIQTSAAALLYALTHNHPFFNGNKRTSVVSTLVFLERHNVMLTCSEDDIYKFSLELADHKLVKKEDRYHDAEVYAAASWLDKYSRTTEKGERAVTLKKLRQILSHFDCEILDGGRVSRTIESKKTNWMGRTSKRTLTSNQIISKTILEGREVDKALIKSIRQDLELTDEYGIDSEIFYGKEPFTVNDFINKYKTLLRRLSKV